jgi:hypothetical protein
MASRNDSIVAAGLREVRNSRPFNVGPNASFYRLNGISPASGVKHSPQSISRRWSNLSWGSSVHGASRNPSMTPNASPTRKLCLRDSDAADASAVCTTNFDFLLERQYDLTPWYVYPVVDEEQLSISNGNAGTLLLKLHGDLRHLSRLVVTESDYDGFLSPFPLM